MLQQDSEMRKTMLFDRMPQEQCEALAAKSELRTYTAGTVVHSQGDTLRGVLVVSKGRLKLLRSAGKDKTQVIDIAKPGQCMGEVQLLTEMPAVASAVAEEDTECWFIPADVVMPILMDDPVVAGALLWHLAAKIRRIVPLIEDLSLHTVPERVAKLILYFHRDAPDKSFVEFRETQESLARDIGSSREALNRGLKMLGELGFVQNSYPVVHILDEAKLRRFADGF
jgi:CRP/FNR family transcriptional regulator